MRATYYVLRHPITVAVDNSFDARYHGGGNVDVLPFLRVFPQMRGERFRYYKGEWTIHFGWLWWTVVVQWHPTPEAKP